MQRKRNEADVAAARAMVAIGGPGNRTADVARRFGISFNTARQWCDPEHRVARIAAAGAWARSNAARVNAAARVRRAGMTDDQKARLAADARRRYAAAGADQFRALVAAAGPDEQSMLADKLRLAAMGWSGRTAVVFGALMAAVTGCTQQEFTRHFDGDPPLAYIVPLSRFDLTDPAHVVRANHPSNMMLGDPGSVGPIDVMSLQWTGNPDALVLAQTFISRQLARCVAVPSPSRTVGAE